MAHDDDVERGLWVLVGLVVLLYVLLCAICAVATSKRKLYVWPDSRLKALERRLNDVEYSVGAAPPPPEPKFAEDLVKLLERRLDEVEDKLAPPEHLLKVDAGNLGECAFVLKGYNFVTKSWDHPVRVEAVWNKACEKLNLHPDMQIGFLVKDETMLDRHSTMQQVNVKPGDKIYMVTEAQWAAATPPVVEFLLDTSSKTNPVVLNWAKEVQVRSGCSVLPTHWELDSTDVQLAASAVSEPRPGMLGIHSTNEAKFPARKVKQPTTFRVRGLVSPSSGKWMVSSWSPASNSKAFASLLERQVEDDAKAMVDRVNSKLESGVNDDELTGYVEKLKSYRQAVAALCGSPWVEWKAPGECQVCKKAVDRADKGLHCASGGHRICWGCMVKNINWVDAVRKDPEQLKKTCIECGAADGTPEGYVAVNASNGEEKKNIIYAPRHTKVHPDTGSVVE